MSFYFSIHCSRCDKLIGYHCGHPHGYVLCAECKEIEEKEDTP